MVWSAEPAAIPAMLLGSSVTAGMATAAWAGAAPSPAGLQPAGRNRASEQAESSTRRRMGRSLDVK